MASYLRPRRGKKATATSNNIVLKRGEVFFEVPDTGVGTGMGKIKMGDGSTSYANLPYFNEAINPTRVTNLETSVTNLNNDMTALLNANLTRLFFSRSFITNIDVANSANSFYLAICFGLDGNGALISGSGCIFTYQTGTNNVKDFCFYVGSSTACFTQIPTSGLVMGLYPKSGYVVVTNILKIF